MVKTSLCALLLALGLSSCAIFGNSSAVEAKGFVVWDMDKTQSVGGHKTTPVGAPRIVDTPSGRAVEFDGIDDGLLVYNHPLASWEQFTIEIVFRPDAEGAKAQRFLHLQSDASDDRILMELRTTNGTWFLDTFVKSGEENETLYDDEALHPVGQWYHAALVCDGGEIRHFVNGISECSAAISFKPLDSGKTSIGMRINQISWFKGAVRKVRFTPMALTPAQFMKI